MPSSPRRRPSPTGDEFAVRHRPTNDSATTPEEHDHDHDHRREPTTHTLEVPGATLTYDIRRNDASTEPPLFLIGVADGRRPASRRSPATSPIARSSPTTRAAVERSTKPTIQRRRVTPDQHAATTCTRSIEARRRGPVDVFASSGGAVNALAWSRSTRTTSGRSSPTSRPWPSQVCRTAKQRSPRPGPSTTPTMRSGFGAGDGAVHRARQPSGPVHRRVPPAAPPPDPAMFGHADRGRRHPERPAARPEHALAAPIYQPDFDALRRASTRIVIAVRRRVRGELAQPRRVRGRRAARERRR